MRVVYEPSGKAKEYADLALNIYNGCSHGCTYCYAPRCLKRTYADFVNCVSIRKDILIKLEKDLLDMWEAGDERTVLLSFASDPYQEMEKTEKITRQAIKMFEHFNIGYKILTKNSLVERDIDEFSELAQIGMSISFNDDKMRARFEPYASSIYERIATLRKISKEGCFTWVSVEPVIYPNEAIEVVKRLDFVDLIKVGKINHQVNLENKVDWKKFYYDVVSLLEKMGMEYYIKKDLEKFK